MCSNSVHQFRTEGEAQLLLDLSHLTSYVKLWHLSQYLITRGSPIDAGRRYAPPEDNSAHVSSSIDYSGREKQYPFLI